MKWRAGKARYMAITTTCVSCLEDDNECMVYVLYRRLGKTAVNRNQALVLTHARHSQVAKIGRKTTSALEPQNTFFSNKKPVGFAKNNNESMSQTIAQTV